MARCERNLCVGFQIPDVQCSVWYFYDCLPVKVGRKQSACTTNMVWVAVFINPITLPKLFSFSLLIKWHRVQQWMCLCIWAYTCGSSCLHVQCMCMYLALCFEYFAASLEVVVFKQNSCLPGPHVCCLCLSIHNDQSHKILKYLFWELVWPRGILDSPLVQQLAQKTPSVYGIYLPVCIVAGLEIFLLAEFRACWLHDQFRLMHLIPSCLHGQFQTSYQSVCEVNWFHSPACM